VFAVSFVTIGIMWINHHALFQGVERVDRAILFLNLLLLLSASGSLRSGGTCAYTRHSGRPT